MRVKLFADDGTELADWAVHDLRLAQQGDLGYATIKTDFDVPIPMALIDEIIPNGRVVTMYEFS